MTEEALTLEEARAAYARREWVVARAGFRAAAEQGPLTAADRYALAQTDWWLGDIDESNRNLEEAHRRYLEEGDPAAAAAAALELGIAHLMRNDVAIGSGWVARAARLADELPEGPLQAISCMCSRWKHTWARTLTRAA